MLRFWFTCQTVSIPESVLFPYKQSQEKLYLGAMHRKQTKYKQKNKEIVSHKESNKYFSVILNERSGKVLFNNLLIFKLTKLHFNSLTIDVMHDPLRQGSIMYWFNSVFLFKTSMLSISSIKHLNTFKLTYVNFYYSTATLRNPKWSKILMD